MAVLNRASASNAPTSLARASCIATASDTANAASAYHSKNFAVDTVVKSRKDIPAITASALRRPDSSPMSDLIYKGHQAA